MHHDDLTVKLQNAVAFLKNHPLAELAMQSCQQCGMTYLPLLQQLSHKQGVKHGAASLRRALKELTAPASGIPPMLLETSLRILGRSGAPTVTYTPTEFGRQVLAHLKIECPNPHNEAARKHLYIQMELMTRALQAGWTPEVEKHLATVCDDVQQNIRVDVFIKRPGEPTLYLEAEQELTANNISRAEEKFEHWQSYVRHFDADAHLHIVFNVARERLGGTLQLWRRALTQLASNERVLFQVSYALLADLMDIPLGQAILERFTALTPLERLKSDDENETVIEDISPFARQVRAYQPHRDLDMAFEAALHEWREAYTAAGRVEAFFALLRCIHQASDLRESGEVFRYNLLPIRSLALLYRYLTLPENQSLYDDLRQAIQWVQGRNLGVTLLRELHTQIIWDVFLAHHDFARGGKLQVSYEIADHMEKFKGFGVLVSYNSSRQSGVENSHPDDAALAWVLTALFTYSEILGLGRLPWKKKPKGGGA
jgi:hypothetical protein